MAKEKESKVKTTAPITDGEENAIREDMKRRGRRR